MESLLFSFSRTFDQFRQLPKYARRILGDKRNQRFLKKSPSIPLAVGFCLGCLVAGGVPLALLSLFVLWPFFGLHRGGLMVFFALLGFGYCHFAVLTPSDQTHGVGRFSPTSVDQGIVRGKLVSFYADGKLVARNLPMITRIEEVPIGDFWVKGTLEGRYLQLDLHAPTLPIKDSYTLTRFRSRVKEWMTQTIQQKVYSKRGAHFLLSMLTGARSDPKLADELGRFGLQHLVAISGFHFSAIAALAALCFKRPLGPMSIVLFLSSYYLLIGPSPAVARAWGMASLALIASILGKEKNSLHFLGIMLFLILLDDPTACTQIGFQFSFLITASIILFNQPFEELLHELIPLKSTSAILAMNTWEKQLYALSLITKKTFALSLAVHLVGIPYLLCLWGKFPVWSLYFNLFYPFFVSLALFLLLFTLVFSWVPIFGNLLFFLLDQYTDTLLSLLYEFPKALDYSFEFSFPPLLLAIYLPLILLTKNGKLTIFSPSYGECSSVG